MGHENSLSCRKTFFDMWNNSPESLSTKLHQISCKWSTRRSSSACDCGQKARKKWPPVQLRQQKPHYLGCKEQWDNETNTKIGQAHCDKVFFEQLGLEVLAGIPNSLE